MRLRYSFWIAIYSVSAEERNGHTGECNQRSVREFCGSDFVYSDKMDIVDIAAVAIIIYYVLKFLRDRRAGKLAFGVVFLFALQMISNLFGFVALSFLMKNIFQIGLIALVILFQPELRSALEKVGGGSIRNIIGMTGDHTRETRESTIEAISEAVCDMSKDKTGALIVIERGTKLGDIVSSGVIVNADVTTFLIKNIFFNKAPLHDGAMIIRDFRIYAAGCFLPLSGNDDIIKDLGTRHRAAIGMSENSDAVVIVVSEETGTISVAFEGKLRRNLDYSSLLDILGEYLPSDSVRSTVIEKIRSRKRGDERL